MNAIYNAGHNTLLERRIAINGDTYYGNLYHCDNGLKCVLENGKEYKPGEDFDLFECDYCDGCGWVEGGAFLKDTCKKCGGIGVIAILPKFLKGHHDKVVKEEVKNEMHDIPCHCPKCEGELEDAINDPKFMEEYKNALKRPSNPEEDPQIDHTHLDGSTEETYWLDVLGILDADCSVSQLKLLKKTYIITRKP